MPAYNQIPVNTISHGGQQIASFIKKESDNRDERTVDSFGKEWTTFDHFTKEEIENAAREYFDIVPKGLLNKQTNVLDLGCGSGRWTMYIANQVKEVEAIDPSNSVLGASRLLSAYTNVRVTQAEVSNIPFEDRAFDFLLCLGVLHHIPDTPAALKAAARKIKPGGHALLYFYYNLDNRGFIYKLLFGIVDLKRRFISRLPFGLKKICCDLLAVLIYMPFILAARLVRLISPDSGFYKRIPLSYYVNKPFRIIRNDSLDRFGTPLEQRFSKKQISRMMQEAGFDEVLFSDEMPYWHCLGRKKD